MSYKKYYVYKQQYSEDGGRTWNDTDPLVTSPSGDPIGEYATLEECQSLTPPTPYENVFLFSDETSVKNISSSSAGGSMNIGIISYVNGVQTDLYSLVEKDMWIQYNSHTATSFGITIERNDTSEQRDGILSLKQNQTSKIITLNVHQN